MAPAALLNGDDQRNIAGVEAQPPAIRVGKTVGLGEQLASIEAKPTALRKKAAEGTYWPEGSLRSWAKPCDAKGRIRYFVGFHSRASRCASAICSGVILAARSSHLSPHG